MEDTKNREVGDKTSLYCSVCGEERTFTWTAWSGMEFFGYPPKQEQGWQCSACGNRVIEA